MAVLAAAPALAGVLSVRIDGVDDPLKAAVVAAAEITQYQNKDITAAQAQRLYTNAGEQIDKALEAFGYYNAKTDGELKETPQGWDAVIHVQPGEPVRVGDFRVEVPSPAREQKPVAKALAEFAPRPGAVFDSVAYEKSKAQVQSALYAAGYLDATATLHKVEISRSANRAAIALEWDVGKRYRFGEVVFEGSQFNAGFLDRYVPWREGDFYSQAQLLRLQQKLVDADYFAIAEVMPDKQSARDGVIPIKVTLAPAKRTIYTAGVFVDSDVGVGVKGSVTRRWINARGHKAKVEAEIAQKLKSLAATYTMPQPGENDRAYNLGAIYNDSDTSTVQSRSLRLVANETRQWHGFMRTLGLNYLTGDFTVATIKGNSSMLYPEASLERKRMDDPTFVRNGYSLILDVKASPGPLSDTHFAQARADAKWIRGIGERQRFIARGTLGMTAVGDFDLLPPELRFFAGGNNSIRGYPFQGVGVALAPALVPAALGRCARDSSLDCNNLIIGGKNLVVASAEYEYYFKPNWGVATFVDVGDAFNAFGSYRNRIGTGIGLRYRSPVGMIRVDLGFPVNDPDGMHGVQLHLVIGPDL
ncbi:MAG: outer membrane protein assembly factor [Proteobacteria bacterium]|nr:outer membrane protein assembly factor [Pseudomonadota bacterium]